MDLEKIIKDRGDYYGYPKCCSDYYADNINEMEPIQNQRIKQMGDYYDMFVQMYCTPCPKCYSVLLRNYKDIKKIYEVKRK